MLDGAGFLKVLHALTLYIVVFGSGSSALGGCSGLMLVVICMKWHSGGRGGVLGVRLRVRG